MLPPCWLAAPKSRRSKAAGAAKLDTVDILVAKSDIAMGQTVSPGDVAGRHGRPPPRAAISSARPTAPKAIENLAGQIARAPFVAGEPIREAKLVNAKGSGFMAAILPSGMRAVSTQISPETGAGGFILPNDHVDVILTRRDRDAEKAAGAEVHTSEIDSQQRPRAGDRPERRGKERPEGRGRQDRDARTCAAAGRDAGASQQLGTLSLALRSITDASHDDSKPTTDRKRAQQRQRRPLRRRAP